MIELILGTGRQKTLRQVVATFESAIVQKQGEPRIIKAGAENVEVTAERADFKGDFQRYTLRLFAQPESVSANLAAIASEHSEVCSVEDDAGWLIVHCPPAGAAVPPEVNDVLDQVSAAIRMPEVWRVSGDHFRVDPISTEMLFQGLIQYKASDVHLSPGETPIFRVDGQTSHSDMLKRLSSEQILGLVRQIAPPPYWQEFEKTKQTSFSFHQAGLGYSRVSAFMKNGAVHCTFRFLPEIIPSFDNLNVPAETMTQLGNLHHGLVLITGMTGSGKTTTAAALLDYINTNKAYHIITIENPIEYVHKNKKSVVSQRNLGEDVNSFYDAVTGALRHDPDVILIGEMRDSDTIRSAINAAATGHLVISTLHSSTASEVVNRIVSFFDPVERDLVKVQLCDCVKCIICQRLVPKIGGGRQPALEFLFNDIKPISDGIIEGDTDAIRIGMQQTVSHSFLFEEYLNKLVRGGKVTVEIAQAFSTDQSMFDQMHMGTYAVPRVESLRTAHAKG